MHAEAELSIVREWVNKAHSDLLCADNNLGAEHVPADAVCFHCQQAAEKLLKAALIARGRTPPRTHILLTLAELLSDQHPSILQLTDDLVILTPYAVASRYPDDGGVVPDLEDATEARQSAAKVLQWFQQIHPDI